jgi:uncharacterized membrane protein
MKESVRGCTLTLPRELPFWGIGFSNLQRAIARVKISWIEDFFISLEKLLERKCLK